MARMALVIVLLWCLVSMVSSWLPLSPNTIDMTAILHSPSWAQWFGTDDLGRSIWQRVIVGARVSLLVAFIVVSIGVISGSIIGAIAGYVGGAVDRAIVYVIDVFLAFPGILLAIAFAGVLGPGLGNVIIALSLVSWVGYARLVRAQVLSIKQREHVVAARALGVPAPTIVVRHIFPLTLAPIMVEATFAIAAVVIGEAGLSFLGLGAQPPAATWGNMIRDGSRYLMVAPHMVFAPGLALVLVVVSVNILGDQLRDKLDVKDRFSRR